MNSVGFLVQLAALIGTMISMGSALMFIFVKYNRWQEKKHLEYISPLKDDINYIKENFKSNGGTSLKDSLDRIEEGLNVLRISSHMLYRIQDIGYLETDAKGELTYVNKVHTQLLDMNPDELYGNGWVNAIHPDDRDRVMREWIDAQTQLRDMYLNFMTHNNKNIRAHCTPVMCGGTLVKWVCSLEQV